MFEKFEIAVSIGDANKAALALRCCGLTPTQVEEVIKTETCVAIQDYGIVPKNSIAPDIIDKFGIEHIPDAISILYYYMDEFEFDWETMKYVLNTLLSVYRAEDLIRNPDYIMFFTNKVKLIIEETYGADEVNNPVYIVSTIEELSDDDIRTYCRDVNISSEE